MNTLTDEGIERIMARVREKNPDYPCGFDSDMWGLTAGVANTKGAEDLKRYKTGEVTDDEIHQIETTYGLPFPEYTELLQVAVDGHEVLELYGKLHDRKKKIVSGEITPLIGD